MNHDSSEVATWGRYSLPRLYHYTMLGQSQISTSNQISINKAQSLSSGYKSWGCANVLKLVGGIPTPLKNMKVSWDDEIPNRMEKKKCSTRLGFTGIFLGNFSSIWDIWWYSLVYPTCHSMKNRIPIIGYIVRKKPGGGITPELIINQSSGFLVADQCEDALVRILDDLYWCASPIPTLRFSNVAMENPPLMTFQTSIGDFPLPCFMTPEDISTLLGDQPFDRPQNLWLSLHQAWANGGTPLFLHDWIDGVHEKSRVCFELIVVVVDYIRFFVDWIHVRWLNLRMLVD